MKNEENITVEFNAIEITKYENKAMRDPLPLGLFLEFEAIIN